MANDGRKTSNLEIASSASSTDRVVIVANPGTAEKTTKTITVANLLGNSDFILAANTLITKDKRTPANSTITVKKGTIFFDDSYLYIATSNNVIKRASLESF